MAIKDADGLTPKQRRFVEEYRVDLNGRQAAIRAGYKPNAAQEQASVLLATPKIAKVVAGVTQKQLDKVGLTAQKTLDAIRKPIDADVRKLFDEKGNLRPIVDLGDDEAALIGGFEVIVKNAQAGDGHTDIVHKVKLVDRGRYVEMAAKHFKLLTDVMEHKGAVDLVDRIRKARERSGK